MTTSTASKPRHVLGSSNEIAKLSEVSPIWLGESVRELLDQLGNMNSTLSEINMRLGEIRLEMEMRRSPFAK